VAARKVTPAHHQHVPADPSAARSAATGRKFSKLDELDGVSADRGGAEVDTGLTLSASPRRPRECRSRWTSASGGAVRKAGKGGIHVLRSSGVTRGWPIYAIGGSVGKRGVEVISER
jgi:hypothetical protein